MRWSASRLRWVLLVSALLLAGVVAGFFGLARYRAGKIWQRILARSGVNLRQETNGFTYSQSSKGRTIFTLHASKATPLGKNKWALHDAVLILYGREPGRNDRIYGKEFQYDEGEGVAKAMGEVHMDLQAPEPGGKAPPAGSQPPLGFQQEDDAAEDPGVIHVRTSGLVYMRKMGIAATGEMAEFRYGGITCVSHGAEFDSAQSVVRLLADVRMTGTERGAAYALTASHADLNRTANTADLASPVLSSGDRSTRSAHALLHLRKDGTLSAMQADGAVEMRSGTATVKAPQANVIFADQDRPQHARLFTGVRFADSNAARPGQGSAATVDLSWTPEGLLSSIAAQGSVQYAGSAPAAEGAVQRRLAGDQMLADFTVAAGANGRRAVLRHVHLTGKAQVGSVRQAPGAGGKAGGTTVSADELDTTFAQDAAGKLYAQDLNGTGHTRLEQVGEDGGRQQSTGDTLLAVFAEPLGAGAASPGAQAVSSATQTGHVDVVTWAAPRPADAGRVPAQTTGHADRAVYAGATRTLTLVATSGGKATVQQPQGEISAGQIVIQQQSGDAEATGGVIATNLGADGQPATHVLASRAQMLHTAGLTYFSGEPGRPAQLWQGGSQVLAAKITLDGKQHGMSARPAGPGDAVHAVFATEARVGSAPENGSQKPANRAGAAGPGLPVNNAAPPASRSAVRVSAAKMDYDDEHHQAVFSGDVRLAGVLGDITADRGTAVLRAAPASSGKSAHPAPEGETPQLGGSLERMVLQGQVRLSQMGRTGLGQQLTYTAATDSFVLTGAPGSPPRVTGEQGSVVTGATLLFRNSDSTIVVAGAEGGPKAPAGRVHTETDLKQGPE